MGKEAVAYTYVVTGGERGGRKGMETQMELSYRCGREEEEDVGSLMPGLALACRRLVGSSSALQVFFFPPVRHAYVMPCFTPPPMLGRADW